MKTLTPGALAAAAVDLACELNAITAITSVEARGDGFDDNGLPKILFERHKFFKYLAESKGRSYALGMTIKEPTICSQKPGGYTGSNTTEHARLTHASAYDRGAALYSASWGMFQIMGFNWKSCGYPNLQAFINDMYDSEDGHLRAFVGFVKGWPALHNAIKAKNWPEVARLYNGPDYARNKYDTKLADAYDTLGAK